MVPGTGIIQLVALLSCAAVLASCSSDAESVCGRAQQIVLLEEQLEPRRVSAPFAMESSTYVSVIADPGYEPDQLFGFLDRPAEIFVVGDGAAPAVTPITDEDSLRRYSYEDPRYNFDGIGEYRRLDEPSGTYRLYSSGRPTVQVVRCPSE